MNMARPDAAPVVVVGAGWSGLACALRLAARGIAPLLLDAAAGPGGRARALELDLGGTACTLDNGQHLLLGAYRETLELLGQVGVPAQQALASRPFAIQYPDGWRLAAAALPAPLHLAAGLLRARGLTPGQRWALARWVRRQRASRWQLAGDRPAAQLFEAMPAPLVRRFWRPLCLAAMNAELDAVCARAFLRVLADSLGAGAAASRILLPRTDLSSLFPRAAIDWLQAHGASVRWHCTVQALRQDPSGAWELQLPGERIAARAVVLALPPARAAALLAPAHAALREAATQLQGLAHAPICTTYLRYAPATRLARPYFTLLDDGAQVRPAQWVFDRGAFDPALAGVLSVIVSGAGAHRDLTREQLGARVAAQLSADLGLPPPLAHYTVVEKQATVVLEPGVARPPVALPLPGLYLAGDAADSPYPSTLEGSVRSGLEAAEALARAADLRA